MQDKNLIEDLPFDLVQQVSSFLDYKSIAHASQAGRVWHGLFNNDSIWKYHLKKDFGIEKDQISQFEKKIKAPNYKQLYVRFDYLSQQRNLPKFIKSICRDKTQSDLILMACTDNFTCLEEMTREQQYIIAVLSIYAGCFKIPYSFIEKHTDQKLLINLLAHAATSGNIKLVKYVLNSENKFGLNPNWSTLNLAAQSGNLQLVQYLLNPKNKFELKPDNNTLKYASKSGNVQLIQYLLNSENNVELTPNNDMLYYAVSSGNLQLVQYLLNLDNKFGLKPNHHILDLAASSGNFQLVQYLLNPKKEFKLKPTEDTLHSAARSGNLQLVQYLLNSENEFALKPTNVNLTWAANSGNLQLVQYLNKLVSEPKIALPLAAESGNLQLLQYLLNPLNKFGLKPENITLNCAARSGNLQLVEYLLNPVNNFELKPDNKTLKHAARSGNLQLVEYLLNPDKNFCLQVTQETLNDTDETKNFALSEYLLPSHLALQDAIEKLQNHDITAAKILLEKSHAACQSHFAMMLQYFVNNPQRFNLDEKDLQWLKEHADILLESEKMRPAGP